MDERKTEETEGTKDGKTEGRKEGRNGGRRDAKWLFQVRFYREGGYPIRRRTFEAVAFKSSYCCKKELEPSGLCRDMTPLAVMALT